MNAIQRGRAARRGFTLIEAMIVIVVMALLAAVAWPAYQETVRKGRRSAAMAAIAKVMQAQERLRSNAATYAANISDIPGAPATSEGSYYTLSIVDGSATASGYAVQATVASGTPQASDSTCGSMTATVQGGTISYTSSTSSGTANSGTDPCWVK